jgi:RNA polymerase sigma-70 factor (ECF subfamily)
MVPSEFGATEQFLLARTASLCAYARMLTSDVQEAEDIVQEVFLKYLRSGPRSQEPHADAWLFRVARNEALNATRCARRRQHRERGYQGPVPSDPNPAIVAERNDDAKRIAECMWRLPTDLREMVYLKFVESFSLREIAEHLGTPRSTVALRIQEGLIELNRLFHGGLCDDS